MLPPEGSCYLYIYGILIGLNKLLSVQVNAAALRNYTTRLRSHLIISRIYRSRTLLNTSGMYPVQPF